MIVIDKKRIISFLQEHRAFLEEQFGITRIALFGSYARDEQTPASDIDLLIDAKEHSFSNRFRLKEFLEEAFQKKVDIGYFDSVRGFIMRHIEEDLVYV